MARVVPPFPRLVLAALLSATSACERGPAVPELTSFGALEPAAGEAVADQLAVVRERPNDADAWGVLAMTLEANGATPQATSTYATATTLESDHGRWWYHLGRLRARDGDTDGALAAFDASIARSPDYVPARWRRGQLLLDRGELAGAEAAFRVALNLAPGDAAGATGLARVQLATDRAADAVETLETLLERAPAERYAYQVLAGAYRALGRSAEAAEAAAAGAGGQPEFVDPWLDEMAACRRGFAAMLKEATALGAAGRYADGIAVLERLRAERPDDRELRTYLAGFYAAAGRTKEARPLLDVLLREHADDFDATMHLATTQLFEGALESADGTVARALAIRPGDADATRLRGVIAWRRQRLDDAERWLGEAAAANSTDAKALGWIGAIRMERKRTASALEAYRAALTRDPLLPDALVGGAAAALDTGAIDDAAKWVARARRLAPGHTGLPDLERRLATRASR